MEHWISLLMVSSLLEFVQNVISYVKRAFASHSQTIRKQGTFCWLISPARPIYVMCFLIPMLSHTNINCNAGMSKAICTGQS